MTTSSREVTRLLLDWKSGDQGALDKLMPLVYDELHHLADRYLRRERPDHTIQATALVNEAFIKLIEQKEVQWQNRAHFFGIAAQLMRRILVDHARARYAEKRGGEGYKLSLNEAIGLPEKRDLDLVALDDALNSLASRDERKSKIVELRFFGGLTIEETAEVLGISLDTVKRDWRMARAWLYSEISKEDHRDA
jgi:RNA polymerase sigma factor (TIGR02999 family)